MKARFTLLLQTLQLLPVALGSKSAPPQHSLQDTVLTRLCANSSGLTSCQSSHSFTACHPYLSCLCLTVKPIATSGPLHWPFSNKPEKFIPKIPKWLAPSCHFGFSLNVTFSKKTCLTSLSKWCQPFFLSPLCFTLLLVLVII